MPGDPRNFIERSDSITASLYGESMSPEGIADNFALYGLQKRAAALESFDAELRESIDAQSGDLRRHAQMLTLQRRMRNVHAALRKAGR